MRSSLSLSCLSLFDEEEEIRRELVLSLFRVRLEMIVEEDFTGRLSRFGGRAGTRLSVELQWKINSRYRQMRSYL